MLAERALGLVGVEVNVQALVVHLRNAEQRFADIADVNLHVHLLTVVASQVIDPLAEISDLLATLAGWNVLETSP